MDASTLLSPRRSGQSPFSRELSVRACESSLWVALFAAEQAGLPNLAAEIAALHAVAGDERRSLESESAT